MYVYPVLALAIASEVTATVSLKLSEGFSKVGPSIVVVVGYLAAFQGMAYVLKKGLPLGVTYAVWAAVGVAGVAVIGVLFFGERFTVSTVIGLLLVIGGVITLELGSAS